MVYRRGETIFRGLVLIKPSALRSEKYYKRYSKSKDMSTVYVSFSPTFQQSLLKIQYELLQVRTCSLLF